MGDAVKVKLHFVVAAAALVISACTGAEPEEAQPDSGVVADGGVEGTDAGPQAARYLVAKKGLFGDSPTDNRFLNPDFDLLAEGWQPYPTNLIGATALPVVQRLFVTESPTRQPILLMPKAPKNTHGVGIVGIARAGAGAFDVSVWIGRNTDAAEEPVSASVVGVDPEQGELAWDLTPDAETKVELGGRVWVRYAVRLAVGPVGFANLVVADETEAPIYLTGPVMVPAALGIRASGKAGVSGRPLKVHEQAGLSALSAAQLQLTDPTRANGPKLPRPAPLR